MTDILLKNYVDFENLLYTIEVDPNKLNACIDNILTRVDRLEAKLADAQPVKHGEWLNCMYDDTLKYWSATCSCCGNISTDPFCIIGSHKSCEHCGARMDLKDGDTNERS